MKRRRGRGEEKKKGGEKGEERRGEISVFTGALYTFYVNSTILKISTPAAGKQLGFGFLFP